MEKTLNQFMDEYSEAEKNYRTDANVLVFLLLIPTLISIWSIKAGLILFLAFICYLLIESNRLKQLDMTVLALIQKTMVANARLQVINHNETISELKDIKSTLCEK